MENYFTIRLEDLRFNARIGVMEQERVVGNEFRVDITMNISADTFRDEDLSSSVSYAEVYELVSNLMKKEYLLLETVAKNIADEILKHWETVFNISVKVTKLAVPVRYMTGSASIEYFSQKKLPKNLAN